MYRGSENRLHLNCKAEPYLNLRSQSLIRNCCSRKYLVFHPFVSEVLFLKPVLLPKDSGLGMGAAAHPGVDGQPLVPRGQPGPERGLERQSR